MSVNFHRVFFEFKINLWIEFVIVLKNVRQSLGSRKNIIEYDGQERPVSLNYISNKIVCLPQNGIPSGDHCPLSQTRRAGPNSSNPRSHVYVAIVPLSSDSSENSTVLWAGEPGKLHGCAVIVKSRRKKFVFLLECCTAVVKMWLFFHMK